MDPEPLDAHARRREEAEEAEAQMKKRLDKQSRRMLWFVIACWVLLVIGFIEVCILVREFNKGPWLW